MIQLVRTKITDLAMKPGEGCQYLKVTSYACKFPPVQDLEDWEGYLLRVLKSLRSADKANWHHRMVARVRLLPGRQQKNKGLMYLRLLTPFMMTRQTILWQLLEQNMNLRNRYSLKQCTLKFGSRTMSAQDDTLYILADT